MFMRTNFGLRGHSIRNIFAVSYIRVTARASAKGQKQLSARAQLLRIHHKHEEQADSKCLRTHHSHRDSKCEREAQPSKRNCEKLSVVSLCNTRDCVRLASADFQFEGASTTHNIPEGEKFLKVLNPRREQAARPRVDN